MSPDDQLVLCDWALFDVRTPKPLHRFDVLSTSAIKGQGGDVPPLLCSAFHPELPTVALNSTVWDLRK